MKGLFAGMVAGVLAAVALTGCTQTIKDADTAIRQTLPQICDGAEIAHAGVLAVAETGVLPANIVAAEIAAYTELQPLCAAPDTATSAQVLVTAIRLSGQIAAALREAEKREKT